VSSAEAQHVSNEDLELFRKAFTEGFKTETRVGRDGIDRVTRGTYHVRKVGSITLPSGRLAVVDPYTFMNTMLARALPPGSYAVDASIRQTIGSWVRTGTDEHVVPPWKPAPDTKSERVAWLLLRISDGSVSSFEKAAGAGVDSGNVAIMSGELWDAEYARANREYRHWWESMKKGVLGAPQVYWARLDEQRHKTPPGEAFIGRYPEDAPQMIDVWPGDSIYPVYWGLDEHGAPVCLAVELDG
jgi:hypothetical protein